MSDSINTIKKLVEFGFILDRLSRGDLSAVIPLVELTHPAKPLPIAKVVNYNYNY